MDLIPDVQGTTGTYILGAHQENVGCYSVVCGCMDWYKPGYSTPHFPDAAFRVGEGFVSEVMLPNKLEGQCGIDRQYWDSLVPRFLRHSHSDRIHIHNLTARHSRGLAWCALRKSTRFQLQSAFDFFCCSTNTMGFYQKCPHTCNHAPSGGNRALSGYIFYNVGGSFGSHMKSKLHPSCTPACPGHLDHANKGRWAKPTSQDWNEWADQVRIRYLNNDSALAAIPTEHLSAALQREAATADEAKEEEEAQEKESEEENDENNGVGEYEGDAEGERFTPARFDQTPGSPPSGPTAAGRSLVDHVVSPVNQSSGHTPLPSLAASPTPSPFQRLDDFEIPWIEPSHFSGTAFFTDPLIIAFVEDPTRQTTKINARKRDSWMCDNLDIPNEWHKRFEGAFPGLAFGAKAGHHWQWEWVS
jgi:hypothetical protein